MGPLARSHFTSVTEDFGQGISSRRHMQSSLSSHSTTETWNWGSCLPLIRLYLDTCGVLKGMGVKYQHQERYRADVTHSEPPVPASEEGRTSLKPQQGTLLYVNLL